MGASAAETVKEIEATRDRLEDDLRELEDRLPSPGPWGKRAILAGGLGGTALLVGVRRVRRKRAAKAAAAVAPVAVIKVLPDDVSEKVSEALEDGSWKPWAGGILAAWALFKLAQIRQMRRMNKALIAAR